LRELKSKQDDMFFRSPQTISQFLMLCSVLLGQSGELPARRGEELLNGYELRTGGKLFRKATARQSAMFVAQLPLKTVSKPTRLLGVFDYDGDGQQEVFLGWTTSQKDDSVHHFQVYRIQGQDTVFLGQFAFEGGPISSIAFYKPPGTEDTPKTVFEVMGGAKWGTYYLLGPDGKGTQALGSGTNYHFIDLEKNGIYDLVVYEERPFEPVCPFGYMSLNPGLFPTIFRKEGPGYAKIWPPTDWLRYDFRLLDRLQRDPTPLLGKHYAVMAAVYDIDRDGAAEIVALTDVVQRGDTKRTLEIYRVSGGSLILKSRVAVAHPDMAVVIYGIRRLRDTAQIVLLSADPKDCASDVARTTGMYSLSRAEGFDFLQGQLRRVWSRKFDQFWPYMPTAVTDVDHTGEEEMTFPDRNGSPFLTLRKESEFITPPAKVLCAIGCPPFCTDPYTKGPACVGEAKPLR
jgi:hypothetical protein